MRSSTDPDTGAESAPAEAQAARSTSHLVEAAGLKFHYLDYGTPGRAPIMCLHGGAVNAHWFDFVAPGFSANYHMRALDQRGHGESAWAEPPDYRYSRYAADLDAVADTLGLREFVLMGHSMGGLVSLVYAATHPGRVKALVVVDSTLVATPERVAMLHEVGARQSRRFATREDFVEQFRVRPAGTQAPRSMIRYLGERSGRQDADGSWRHKFDRNVYSGREFLDIPPHWNRIEIPVLLVKGGLSSRITPEIHADIRACCPHVEFAEIPGAEHHVTLDNPGGFVAAVTAFLDRHS